MTGFSSNEWSPPTGFTNPSVSDTSETQCALVAALHEVGNVDRALYQAIAVTPTPTLDEPLRQLSRAANNSLLWLAIAAAIAATGGRRARRAATVGIAALTIDSAIVNLVLKPMRDRARPARVAAGVPEHRQVPMPSSSSFPSGHSASAFAFATAVSGTQPQLAVPMRALATAVAYSRVHTGVHYPSDVVVGSLVGAIIGEAAALTARTLRHRRRLAHD